jgi:hypothetical protein
MQFAEEVGTEAEFEEELPELRAQMVQVLGKQMKTRGVDIDDVMSDAELLNKLSESCSKISQGIRKRVDADAESIRLDLVCPLFYRIAAYVLACSWGFNIKVQEPFPHCNKMAPSPFQSHRISSKASHILPCISPGSDCNCTQVSWPVQHRQRAP